MLIVAAAFQDAFAQLGLDTPALVRAHFLPGPIPAKTTVIVKPATLVQSDGSSMEVFYKQYEYAPPTWRFLGRPSKARCEYDNYGVFMRLKLPCARRVAWGEERDGWSRLRRAFILTQAIPDAVSLKEFFQAPAGLTSSLRRSLRRTLRNQLADMTRRIHAADFYHHDLVWRNLLVTWRAPAAPQLWWIDCPRGGFVRWSPGRERRRIKDLASLDKVASQVCTRTERAAFIRAYLGRPSLDVEARKLIRAVLAYRRKRWPKDWHETRPATPPTAGHS